jgi:hypothetical protein
MPDFLLRNTATDELYVVSGTAPINVSSMVPKGHTYAPYVLSNAGPNVVVPDNAILDALWDPRPPYVNTSTPGAALTSIEDSSGSGNHATNGNSRTYETDGTRHWVGSATGTGGWLDIPSGIVRAAPGVTFCAASRRLSGTGDLIRITAASSGTTWLTMRQSTTGAFQIRGRRVWTDSQQITDFGAHSVGQDYAVMVRIDFSTGAMRCWVNGSIVLNGTFHSGGLTEDANASTAGIFETMEGRGYAAGIARRAVTDAEAATLNAFFMDRAGVS